MDKYLLKHECHRCGAMDEMRLSVSNKHIKATCLHCDAYIKFLPHEELIKVPHIRQHIWSVAGGDLSVINKAKDAIGFNKRMDNVSIFAIHIPNNILIRLYYWELYLKVRELCQTF